MRGAFCAIVTSLNGHGVVQLHLVFKAIRPFTEKDFILLQRRNRESRTYNLLGFHYVLILDRVQRHRVAGQQPINARHADDGPSFWLLEAFGLNLGSSLPDWSLFGRRRGLGRERHRGQQQHEHIDTYIKRSLTCSSIF